MKVKALVDLFDIKKGTIYPVISHGEDWVKILDDKDEIMYLYFDVISEEYEVVEE